MAQPQRPTNLERRDFRLTKIVCTLGPKSKETDRIAEMARAGMNVARLNLSHGDHVSHEELIRKIKALNKELNHPIAILVDLQGPEIRTGDLDEEMTLVGGEIAWLSTAEHADPRAKSVIVNYDALVSDLKAGDRVSVDNGLVNLQVLEVQAQRLKCRVLDGGKIGSRRHVNLPGIRVKLPAITAKDKKDIAFAIKHDVDLLALSFVRRSDDVHEARRLIERGGGAIRIISKIENQEGVENFEGILAASDGIMVARGDLGVEVDIRELPVIQRRIVRACAEIGKPVIVATHLLESMTFNVTPTRAEVSDVANAVYEQADALMLSGETGTGLHPVRCIQVMDSIARRIEKEPGLDFYERRFARDAREEMARSACRLADSSGAQAIIAITRHGTLAQLLSGFRPKRAIIYAITNSEHVQRRLWLLRSVVPMVTRLSGDPEKTVRRALTILRQRSRLLPGDPVVVLTDVPAGRERITSMQVRFFD